MYFFFFPHHIHFIIHITLTLLQNLNLKRFASLQLHGSDPRSLGNPSFIPFITKPNYSQFSILSSLLFFLLSSIQHSSRYPFFSRSSSSVLPFYFVFVALLLLNLSLFVSHRLSDGKTAFSCKNCGVGPFLFFLIFFGFWNLVVFLPT